MKLIDNSSKYLIKKSGLGLCLYHITYYLVKTIRRWFQIYIHIFAIITLKAKFTPVGECIWRFSNICWRIDCQIYIIWTNTSKKTFLNINSFFLVFLDFGIYPFFQIRGTNHVRFASISIKKGKVEARLKSFPYFNSFIVETR